MIRVDAPPVPLPEMIRADAPPAPPPGNILPDPRRKRFPSTAPARQRENRSGGFLQTTILSHRPRPSSTHAV